MAKYGRDHFREIGRVGYRTTLARHWQGDTEGYHRWLCARGWDVTLQQAADRELDRRLADGAKTTCIELPPPLDDEEQWDYRASISGVQCRYEASLAF